MIIKAAKRTESVQEYYFSRKLKEIAAMNAERKERGEELVINLGIGSPDGMPPMPAIEALCESAAQRETMHTRAMWDFRSSDRRLPIGMLVGMELHWIRQRRSSRLWAPRRRSC